MTDGGNLFDQPIKKVLRIYDNIRNISIDHGDDYATGCLISYPYFKKYFQMTAIDLSKGQALDADLKAIQQIKQEIQQ